MHQFGPAGAVKLSLGRTAVFVDAAVEPVELAIRRRRPDVIGHGLGKRAELPLAGANRPLGGDPFGDVDSLDEDAGDVVVVVADRLKNEVDEALFRRRVGCALQGHGERIAKEGFAGLIDPVEKFVEALTSEIRQSVTNGSAHDFAVADQLQIAAVRHFEHMVRPAQQRHETGRLPEHLLEPFPLVLHLAFGPDLLGRFDDKDDRRHRDAALVDDGRIVEVQVDLLGDSVAFEGELLVAVGQSLSRKHRLDDIVVEVGNLWPGFAHPGAKRTRVAQTGEFGIPVVVNHDAVFAPQHHDRHRGAERQRNAGLEMPGPVGQRAETGFGPVVLCYQIPEFSAAFQKGRLGAARRYKSLFRHADHSADWHI